MKIKPLLLFILFIPAALSADQIYLTDNTVINCSITEITADSVNYTDNANQPASVKREKTEKIVYSGGREITFYDIIQLKDGTTLSGRVIRKTEQYIEYNPAGPVPFDRIETDKVAGIIYADGRKDKASEPLRQYDEIYLKDGRTLKGTGILINDKNIEFSDESGNRQFYGRAIVEKIIYRDNRVEYPDKETAESGTKKETSSGTVNSSVINSFAEFEWGWNGYTGAGARLDYMFIDHFSLNGGLGIGFWGWRLSGALRYYPDYPYGPAFSIGAAYNTGGKSKVRTEVRDGSGATYNRNVDFEYKPVTTINASILYSWQVFGKDRFYIEAGYSYAIQKDKYDVEDNYRLTDESKDEMDMIAPGGVMLTVGYAFNLN